MHPFVGLGSKVARGQRSSGRRRSAEMADLEAKLREMPRAQVIDMLRDYLASVTDSDHAAVRQAINRLPRENTAALTAKVSQLHVAALEESDDDSVWSLAGLPHLVLQTLGRKSNRVHKVALPFWLDAGACRLVVGSHAGSSRHPAWYHNLCDRRANPEVLVRDQHKAYWAEALVLEGDEYQATWLALTSKHPFYQELQSLTERRIPLIRLIQRRPA